MSALRKYDATFIVLHEGNPGHHFQSVFGKRQRNFPQFIRFSSPVAYSEGWGLYSEYLGFELGVYEDPYAKFGYYSANLLRASRLVVDTGIHSLGWSRSQAVEYMLNNTAFSRESIEAEVDRYITLPGQACTYKIGDQRIKSLRKITAEELGTKFNVKEFHRVVLSCAGPLSVLDKCVERFIAKEKKKDENEP